MIHSARDLTRALEGTLLAGRKTIELEVLDTGETAFAIEIAGSETYLAWSAARALVGDTGRWPVATCCWSPGGAEPWESQVRSADFFSRFYFQGEDAQGMAPSEATRPRAILQAAASADVDRLLDLRATARLESEELRRETVQAALAISSEDILGLLDGLDTYEDLRTRFVVDLLEHESAHQGQLIRYLYGLALPIPAGWKTRFALAG